MDVIHDFLNIQSVEIVRLYSSLNGRCVVESKCCVLSFQRTVVAGRLYLQSRLQVHLIQVFKLVPSFDWDRLKTCIRTRPTQPAHFAK